MAQKYGEAWLTSALDDDGVIQALVLAESLRRSMTTRRTGVIVSNSISLEKRMALRKSFDAVFFLDETFLSNSSLGDEDRAKIFAFSLKLFEKCIFLPCTTLILSNVDKLFEGGKRFKVMKNLKDGSFDLSMCLFSPNLGLCEYFEDNVGKNGKTISERFLKKWLKMEYGTKAVSYFPGNSLLKMSISKGTISRRRTHAPIIQFIDHGGNLAQELLSLTKQDLGLPEKLIAENWLEIYHGKVNFLLNSPKLIEEKLQEIYENEPIAIIGMSCRYPGANNLEEFWNLLYAGEEAIRPPPAFRWTKEHSLRVSKMERSTNAGFLSTSVDEFDAKFFGISPKEAQFMDPQARILHEVLWEALEDGGIDPLSLKGTRGGVFIGSWMNDYKDIVQGSTEKDFFRTYMGNSIGATAARLSFLLGLHGPSIATESGCSSAIVALDLAIKSLRSGESSVAMAGGVNLLLHPFTSTIMDYVIAPDGRCKTFDRRANGFGRAEGCGVLILKRLSDAMRDGDNIWAMLQGSALSQEGTSKSLGTPTVDCEATAMELALKDAGVHPSQVSFVETHGTGTSVGDPMEVEALRKAYNSPERRTPLVIGSLKSNLGHTESCSGITGIMKAILAMQHELIPKHKCLESGFILNPEINLDSIPAIIPIEHIPWLKVKGQPRIAGISSFGITGTDGHVILQESPDIEYPKFHLGLERPLHILKISSKSPEGLEDLLERYRIHFQGLSGSDQNFSNAAYTANVGRANFPHRAFILSKDYEGAIKSLEGQCLRGNEDSSVEKKLCFLFTGQGSQYHGMAKVLYESSPVFRVNFDFCQKLLLRTYGISIRPILWENLEDPNKLNQTLYSQTSIFVVEYCLLKLWKSWGIKPDYVLGHSLGELGASVAAGALTLEDALMLVAERSRLIDSLPLGKMLVIKASKVQVDEAISHMKKRDPNFWVDFAAINSSEQTVVAGDSEMIQEFATFCQGFKQGLKCVVLASSHAFHSRHMDPILQEYRRIASSISIPKSEDLPKGLPKYISGMEGKLLEIDSIDADYWVRHTREKVSFLDACRTLKDLNCTNFLEVGPHPVLSSFVMINAQDAGTAPVNCLPSLRRGNDEWETILSSLGKLYLQGYPVNWKGFDEPYIRRKVSLPFHPFHKKSYWVESVGSHVTSIHPLIGQNVSNASSLKIFQNDLILKTVPYLKDHCIGNKIVFPGAGYTEMCLSAGFCVANGLTEQLVRPRRAIRVENVKIDAPLELKEGRQCRLQVLVDLPEESSSPNDSDSTHGSFRVKIFHQNTVESSEFNSSGKWVLHATSNFTPVPSTNDALAFWHPEDIQEVIDKGEEQTSESFYQAVEDSGLKFGDSFRSIIRHWNLKDGGRSVDRVVAEVGIPDDFNKYLLHPLVIDAAIQTGIVTRMRYESSKLKIPIKIGKLTLLPFDSQGEGQDQEGQTSQESFWIYAWNENDKFYMFVTNKTMTPIALIEDVQLIDTNVKTIESVLEKQSNKYPDSWEEVWKPIGGPTSNQVELITPPPLSQCRELQAELEQDEGRFVEIQKKTFRLLYLYILKAFHELGWSPKLGEVTDPQKFSKDYGIAPQLRQMIRFYFQTLDKVLTLEPDKESWKVTKLPPSMEEVQPEIESLFNFLCQTKASKVTNIYKRIASSLPKILRGDESALTILFPTDNKEKDYSADSFYQNYPGRSDIWTKMKILLVNIFENLFRANDSKTEKVYRVLEVGSGTGSLSLDAVTWLQRIWGSNFEYYYTDISQSFFLKAENKLEPFKNNLKFCIFNLEEPPLEQGIPLNYFDCVLATDVLHATRSIHESLVHIRQTMRPGGTLCFTETITQALDVTFVFGLVDGYWRFQDFDLRPHHTCCGPLIWEKALEGSGFHSVQVAPAYLNTFACIQAEACRDVDPRKLVGSPMPQGSKGRWVIFTQGNNAALEETSNFLQVSGYRVDNIFNSLEYNQIETLLTGDNLQGIIYAWGLDLNEKEQNRLALPFLHIAKCVLSMKKPPRLYVFTQGVQPVMDSLTSNPTSATLWGMAKSLKNENNDLSIHLIDLDNDSTSKSSGAEEVLDQILYEVAMTKDMSRLQVAYRSGQRYEPRFTKVTTPTLQDELQLPQSTDRYHLTLPASRLISDLQFEALDQQVLLEDEIEVKVKAYALNFKDILTILKPTAEFEKLNTVGLDYSGVVTRVGHQVAPEVMKVGDRVFGCNFNESQLPSHLISKPHGVIRIPEEMTFWEAATLPAVFSTAYYCLVKVAKMKKGDTVLIHTGSGGVGQCAIQLARHIGAEIITTAGNPRKRSYLKSMGMKHVFNSRSNSFEKDIQKVTNGRGVDIVLNSITGPGLKEASLNSSARNARFVEMSKLAIWSEEEVMLLRPDVDYSIVDLTHLEHSTWRELLQEMNKFLENGQVEPIPFVKFDALRIRQALQYFQKAKHIGKVVCVMPEVRKREGEFKVDVPLFNSEGTYLITGGLGGIGFEVAKWMLDKGALNIVLTGRNPPKPEVTEKIQEMNEKGSNLQVKFADVGNYQEIRAVIEYISKSGRPLKGIMHCAGVLRDNLYANQSWESFEATYRPKVSGTWNLHHLTKNLRLEHFVFYSSITSMVGTPAQPNHASANCFEDAFAHYRHSLGLPATSINWGQWGECGCAKEITMSGVLPVSVKRMLNGLEATLRDQSTRACFMDFESFSTWSLLCPSFKSYLDERLWKQLNKNVETGPSLNMNLFWEDMDKATGKEEKMLVMDTYLKRILRKALRMDADEAINCDADIQDLGVDSLMLIELRNGIQTLLGSRVNVTSSLLKDCHTVKQISCAIISKLVGDEEVEEPEEMGPEELTTLLKSDCDLPSDIAPKTKPSENGFRYPSEIKNILLTGSTGQLGPYIIAELCNEYKSVEKIVCLIRTKEGANPTDKLLKILKSMDLLTKVDIDKILCLQGDISQPNLGLNENDYKSLCLSVDAVIHCAVKANHVEPYRKYEGHERLSDIRTINVSGTLNVLRFAVESSIPKQIYYASAYTSIFGGNEKGTLSDEWPELDQIEFIVQNKVPGYQTSKFVCEHLMKQANSRGIPCKVFRFPWITGESLTGRLNYSNNHNILRYLSYLKLRMMPSLVAPAIVLPVDLCAKLSLKLFLNDEAPFEVYNVGHPQPQLEQEFVSVAMQDFGIPVEVVEFHQFAERLEKDESPLESFKELYADVERVINIFTSDSLQAIHGYLTSYDTFFKNEKLERFIPDFDKEFPSSMDIIRKDLNYVKTQGFFEKFGI